MTIQNKEPFIVGHFVDNSIEEDWYIILIDEDKSEKTVSIEEFVETENKAFKVPIEEITSGIVAGLKFSPALYDVDLTYLTAADLNDEMMPYVKLETMASMFEGCDLLVEANLSGLDTGNVKDMKQMFFGCKSLVYVNFSNINTRNVEHVRNMFKGCSSLYMLDLSGLDLSLVEDIAGMFHGCSSLEWLSLYLNTDCNIEGAFDGCVSLRDYYGSIGGHDYWCHTFDLSDCPLSNESVERIVKNLPEIEYYSPEDDCDPEGYFHNLYFSFNTYIHIDRGLINYALKKGWNITYQIKFDYSTPLDFTEINAAKLRDLSELFAMAPVKHLDLAHLNTSYADDFSEMFDFCRHLESLDLSGFKTNNAVMMNGIFAGCESIKSLDLSSFDTRDVQGFEDMFCLCLSLSELDLSNFDTSNARSMYGMFYSCKNLTSLHIEFDAAKVRDLRGMFVGCNSLANVTGFFTNIKDHIDLQDCPLTVDSAMLFINGLAKVENEHFILFHTNTYDKLSDSRIQIANDKGWTVVRGDEIHYEGKTISFRMYIEGRRYFKTMMYDWRKYKLIGPQ